MAHISARLLEQIEDGTVGTGGAATSCAAVVTRAISAATVDGICADLGEYLRACETLSVEQVRCL